MGERQVLAANQSPAELTEPGIGAFQDLSAHMAPRLAPIVIALHSRVLAMRRGPLDSQLLPPLGYWIGVISGIDGYAPWPLPRPAFGFGRVDLGEPGFRNKRNFRRRGSFQRTSQRRTLTADRPRPLRSFSAPGLATNWPSKGISSEGNATLLQFVKSTESHRNRLTSIPKAVPGPASLIAVTAITAQSISSTEPARFTELHPRHPRPACAAFYL